MGMKEARVWVEEEGVSWTENRCGSGVQSAGRVDEEKKRRYE